MYTILRVHIIIFILFMGFLTLYAQYALFRDNCKPLPLLLHHVIPCMSSPQTPSSLHPIHIPPYSLISVPYVTDNNVVSKTIA